MKLSILAARRQQAIERITAASGLDLSAGLPKTPDVAHRELLILERIADHMEAQHEESAAGSIADMTVKDALAAVESGQMSARDALAMEEARGSEARVSLVRDLQKRIAAESEGDDDGADG